MNSLTDIRTDLAAALDDLDEKVYPHPPATPEMPCVIIGWPSEIDFDRTLSGRHGYTLALTLLVSLSDIERAELELDAIINGPLRGLLANHTTTVWREMHVESVNNIRPEKVGQASVLAADINLSFIA